GAEPNLGGVGGAEKQRRVGLGSVATMVAVEVQRAGLGAVVAGDAEHSDVDLRELLRRRQELLPVAIVTGVRQPGSDQPAALAQEDAVNVPVRAIAAIPARVECFPYRIRLGV